MDIFILHLENCYDYVISGFIVGVFSTEENAKNEVVHRNYKDIVWELNFLGECVAYVDHDKRNEEWFRVEKKELDKGEYSK